jgi:hypothetical protein
MRERLDQLLGTAEGEADRSVTEDVLGSAPAALLKLRGNPGRPSLASMQEELTKLDLIRRMDLPADLFDHASPRDLERYRRRVAVEAPHELRRHPDAARIVWLAAFVYLCARGLIDDLVDLLIDDLKRVTGKQNLLFELADATLAQPDGVVRAVVFPVVGEQTLRDLVKEWKATGPTYRTTLRTVIRNSYQGQYRRMVPKLLVALEFRSNNERHRPVMQALELVKRFADSKVRTFPADEEVPLEVSCVASGATPWLKRTLPAVIALIVSPTKYPFWKPCVNSCAARKSGSSAPIVIATRMRTMAA